MNYSNIKYLHLYVQGIPLYLNDILKKLLNPSISLYLNPFSKKEIDEANYNNNFKFIYSFFLHNKPFGLMKKKKEGRLKRKIQKRLILLNKIID